MEHGRLDSILGSFSLPEIDFSPLTRPKIPAHSPNFQHVQQYTMEYSKPEY
jgi:hypothetical protein